MRLIFISQSNFRLTVRYVKNLLQFLWKTVTSQGAYIKYVGGGAGGFYKFFKKIFVAQKTIDLNLSRPSNFFRKYFMAPPINFSFLFKAYLQWYFGVVLSNIQILNHQRSWHSQSVQFSKKPLVFLPYKNSFATKK